MFLCFDFYSFWSPVFVSRTTRFNLSNWSELIKIIQNYLKRKNFILNFLKIRNPNSGFNNFKFENSVHSESSCRLRLCPSTHSINNVPFISKLTYFSHFLKIIENIFRQISFLSLFNFLPICVGKLRIFGKPN